MARWRMFKELQFQAFAGTEQQRYWASSCLLSDLLLKKIWRLCRMEASTPTSQPCQRDEVKNQHTTENLAHHQQNPKSAITLLTWHPWSQTKSHWIQREFVAVCGFHCKTTALQLQHYQLIPAKETGPKMLQWPHSRNTAKALSSWWTAVLILPPAKSQTIYHLCGATRNLHVWTVWTLFLCHTKISSLLEETRLTTN